MNTLVTKLYEDYAKGILPQNHFERIFQEYDNEQQELGKQIAIFEERLQSIQTKTVEADKFLALIHRYTEITELTPKIINEFIEKVYVHERTGKPRGKGRKQQIDIYFNFIGQFSPSICSTN